jgi:hypothetical protein
MDRRRSVVAAAKDWVVRIHAGAIALSLLICIVTQLAPPARACGPFSIDPVFVFHHSPDLPFEQYTKGKIGIVQPTFGRKTLVIAYHYLNGGVYSDFEQQALADALRGTAPEPDGLDALNNWIAARRELLKPDESLPEIYVERKHQGYDYFPNCAQNAFEVATTTLKSRIASYGADDQNVREWTAGQDSVFQNCSSGSHIPAPVPAAAPAWLKKDRDYQTAAAFFYSLNFEEARRRFAAIAADMDSPWQDTANYLLARTLVRQASLTKDDGATRELFAKAEIELQNLIGQSSAFQNSARKLLGLVQFRLHPQERVEELARTLAGTGGNENLGQDLIDYVWLLDGIEAKILAAEKKRKEALKPQASPSPTPPANQEALQRSEARQRGETIQLGFTPKGPDGKDDYRNYALLDFKYDAPESEILLAFEAKLNRKLTGDEIKEIKELQAGALKNREWTISPNRKWNDGYEGCYYNCEHLTFDLMPDYLRRDDLTDWILTLQTTDPVAYSHAFERSINTGSRAWLVVALIKAEKSSANVTQLMREAEKVARDAPEFPTVAYELVRLQLAFGRPEQARKLVDEVLSTAADSLPVSARNLFLQQRARLAMDVGQFLKFSQRTPVAFYDPEQGRFGSLRELLEIAKASWDEEYAGAETKDEYEKGMEDIYKDRLPWDQRSIFDNEAVDTINWHFSLPSLIEAAHDTSLPDYLRRQVLLAAWTRAILLNRPELAVQITPEVIKAAPEMAAPLNEYLRAKASERDHAALFLLLKFPNLSPYVATGLPSFETAEDVDYYFESSWWCRLPTTEYNDAGQEIAKVVRRPDFMNSKQLEAAATERKQLDLTGDGKSYLGKLVLQWARVAPRDPRIPESLFIAYKANESYKYGCGSWDHDEDLQREVADLLMQRYPESPWTAKLREAIQ